MSKNQPSPAISLTKVTKTYTLRSPHAGLFSPSIQLKNHALENINLTVMSGERVGIIGHNGSGKTTLLHLIAGITNPTSGTITTQGKVIALTALAAGFHSEYSGRENIALQTALYGLSPNFVATITPSILAFAELADAIDQPLYTYSSGMVLRLAFAILTRLPADIYLFDEFLTVGDSDFQEKSRQFIQSLTNRHKTLLITSQDYRLLLPHCHRIVKIDHGHIDPTLELDPHTIAFFESAVRRGVSQATIATDSMIPLLKPGDRINFRRPPFRQVAVNDIVVFAFQNFPQLFAHRVIAKTTQQKKISLITRGDAYPGPDPWFVTAAEYIGIVTHKNNHPLYKSSSYF